MSIIGSTCHRELVWESCAAPRRAYVLRAGGAPIGSLRWLPADNSVASRVETDRWLFEGTDADAVMIRIAATGTLAAQIATEAHGTTLVCRDGPVFRWFPENYLATRWGFACGSNRALLTFHKPSLLGGVSSRVVLGESALALPQLPLLLVAGGYLMAQLLDELAIVLDGLATAPG